MGAVLSQLDDKEKHHPIVYFSKTLLPRETRFISSEKEILAIKLRIQAFLTYLIGRVFKIGTDHRSLEWLNHMEDSNSRQRDVISLQVYDLLLATDQEIVVPTLMHSS